MDAREMLLGGMSDRAEESHVKRGSGANQSKPCCRYVPLPGNTEFRDGRWLEKPYNLLREQTGDAGFEELIVLYTDCVVTVRGFNLGVFADGIGNFRLAELKQTHHDELQAKAAAGSGHPVVYGLSVVELEEG